MRGAGPSPRQSPRALRPDPGPAMSFFRRKVKGKEQEKTSDVKSIKASISVHSPQKSTKNHALLEAAGPSHVAINAISANMDSFSSSRTATLKKQPSHMEAAHFGDLDLVWTTRLKRPNQVFQRLLNKSCMTLLFSLILFNSWNFGEWSIWLNFG